MDAPMTAEEEQERQQGGRKWRQSGGGPAEKRQPSVPCWFCLSNKDADHIMVLAVGHIQSLVAVSAEVRDEVEKYRDVLTLFYDARRKLLVMFEGNFETGHL
ncbi:hypothetical protein QR680_009302 [Steinernema hermaphroditum]|uniref:Cwf19-like C-terminal domain-containing protein n=1 Tax=Steinernema hermaphroditum TaxID=289476 RepID=A0AA39IM83_9BILA|nr:hypothetical protein QR680_009302 [Steinernema hermaphroditum]